jgi:hypothetical protein
MGQWIGGNLRKIDVFRCYDGILSLNRQHIIGDDKQFILSIGKCALSRCSCQEALTGKSKHYSINELPVVDA